MVLVHMGHAKKLETALGAGAIHDCVVSSDQTAINQQPVL